MLPIIFNNSVKYHKQNYNIRILFNISILICLPILFNIKPTEIFYLIILSFVKLCVFLVELCVTAISQRVTKKSQRTTKGSYTFHNQVQSFSNSLTIRNLLKISFFFLFFHTTILVKIDYSSSTFRNRNGHHFFYNFFDISGVRFHSTR